MTRLFTHQCIVKIVDVYCIYLLTWLEICIDWQNLDDLKLEHNKYAISYFDPFDSDWKAGLIFNVYYALA